MPANKLALIRYNIIDECLSNHSRTWTLEDLIDKVSDYLYEYEGINDGISKRTIQQDIQNMRSEKLGYNAPIEVFSKKYYRYSDKSYSIHDIPVTTEDITILNEAISLLRQFKGLGQYEELIPILAKLESKVTHVKDPDHPTIEFETNNNLKGLEHIDPLHRAIKDKCAIYLKYKSFTAQRAQEFIFSPYLLKEYRNRWFVHGKRKNLTEHLTLALDRIVKFDTLGYETFEDTDREILSKHFKDVIGVTKTRKQRARKIVFWVDKKNLPYILTKPLHESQELVKELDDGGLLKMYVVWNFELEREILGFGECIKLLSPKPMAQLIEKRIAKAHTVSKAGFDGSKGILI